MRKIVKYSIITFAVVFLIALYYIYSGPKKWMNNCCPGFFNNNEELRRAEAWYDYYGIREFFEYNINLPQVEKKVTFVYDIPDPSNDIIYNIDLFNENDSNIMIRGWGYIKGISCKNTQIYLCFKSEYKTYFYYTANVMRPDVTKHFGTLNFDDSGFSNMINKKELKPGNYRIGLYIIKDDTLKVLQFTEYQFTIS